MGRMLEAPIYLEHKKIIENKQEENKNKTRRQDTALLIVLKYKNVEYWIKMIQQYNIYNGDSDMYNWQMTLMHDRLVAIMQNAM